MLYKNILHTCHICQHLAISSSLPVVLKIFIQIKIIKLKKGLEKSTKLPEFDFPSNLLKSFQ